MELKRFKKKYGLELIPASNAGLICGTLVWDSLLRPPKLAMDGMANNIFNALLDARLIDEKEWKELLDISAREPLVEASLAESAINFESDLLNSLSQPQLGELGCMVELDKVKRFSFGKIKARLMSNHIRVKLDSYLEKLREDNWKKYDGRIGCLYMITELYYGSVRIEVSREVGIGLESALERAKLNIEHKLDLNDFLEYTFESSAVPFAMRIEKVKTFNG